jgi:hypothetical protein
MSRKFDRQLRINEKALEIIQDPYTLFMLASKLIRKKPKYVPRFIWKGLLSIVMTPESKQKNIQSPQ